MFGIASVLSLALAFYWHGESVQARVPTYYVSPERTTIVDASVQTPSQVQVLYKGKPVTQNVTGVLVYLWNDGKLPIRAEDVLEPIRVQLSPGCEILDVRVVKFSREVTKLGIGQVTETAKNSLPATFSILEQSDGVALQIIYAGTAGAVVSVVGTVVGARQPRILAARDDFEVSSRKDQVRLNQRLGRDALFVSIGFLAFISAVWIVQKKRFDGSRVALPQLFFPLMVALGLFLTVLASLLLNLANEANSPGVPASIWTQG